MSDYVNFGGRQLSEIEKNIFTNSQIMYDYFSGGGETEKYKQKVLEIYNVFGFHIYFFLERFLRDDIFFNIIKFYFIKQGQEMQRADKYSKITPLEKLYNSERYNTIKINNYIEAVIDSIYNLRDTFEFDLFKKWAYGGNIEYYAHQLGTWYKLFDGEQSFRIPSIYLEDVDILKTKKPRNIDLILKSISNLRFHAFLFESSDERLLYPSLHELFVNDRYEYVHQLIIHKENLNNVVNEYLKDRIFSTKISSTKGRELVEERKRQLMELLNKDPEYFDYVNRESVSKNLGDLLPNHYLQIASDWKTTDNNSIKKKQLDRLIYKYYTDIINKQSFEKYLARLLNKNRGQPLTEDELVGHFKDFKRKEKQRRERLRQELSNMEKKKSQAQQTIQNHLSRKRRCNNVDDNFATFVKEQRNLGDNSSIIKLYEMYKSPNRVKQNPRCDIM